MVQIVQALPQSGRTLRRPSHTFQVRHRPYQIQPFAIAPVVPGETLKNALLQARVVSDPVKNPLIGWWYEMYLFYVKHRDMPDSAHFQSMVLQYGYDMSSTVAAAKVEHYHSGGTVDWVDQCMRAVIPNFFREDGEAVDIATIGNLPVAKLNASTWLDSVLPDSQVVTGGSVTSGDTAEKVDLLMQQYQLLRDMKLTTLTYEEFLQSYGVRSALAETPNKPELIRYVRDWTYPSNHIDPTDGSASSALSWAIAERADKDRFFSEPGFIFGCCVARPKVYISKQAGNAAQMLTDAMTWLPAVLVDNPTTSLKQFANTAGPLGAAVPWITEASYWVDVRDLFLYGDQFVNFALTETDAGLVALPTPALQKKYPAAADADGLFASASPANMVRADGVLSLTIASVQRDHTLTS